MKRLLTLSAALFASTALALADGRQAEADLERPSPAVDPNATGHLEMERENNHEQEFSVEIEEIDTASGTYTLWIASNPGSGEMLDAGDFDVDGATRAIYERERERGNREGQGGDLPLGVNNLTQLQNRRLEVRDPAGMTILFTTIPRFSRNQGNNGNGGESGVERELPLLRPAGEPIPTAEGTVSAELEEQDSELEIETEGFDVSSITYSVWIEDANALLQDVGNLLSEGHDEGEISWNTEEGETLPVGAETILELGGRRVEIRDPGGAVVLEGTIPDLSSASSSNQRSNVRLDVTTSGESLDAKGKLNAKLQAKKGRFQLRIQALARTTESDATLWMLDPSTDQMEQVATGRWSGGNRKKIRWEWRSDRSEPLPLGVTDPSELFGRDVEVRNEAGIAILSGRL